MLFLAIAGCGLLRMQVQSDPEKIWVPPTSTTALQQNHFNKVFDPFYRIEQVIFTKKPELGYVRYSPAKLAFRARVEACTFRRFAVDGHGPCPRLATHFLRSAPDHVLCAFLGSGDTNVLLPEYLCAIWDIQNAMNFTKSRDGSVLSDFCFEPMKGQGCMVETPLDYWCVPPSPRKTRAAWYPFSWLCQRG